MQILAKIPHLIALTRIHKPIGIFLLLWPVCWGLWLAAHGLPSIKLAVIFITGVIVMRSAGCIINDIADRNFDRYVKRTQSRPLTTGQIKVYDALIAFSLLCLLGLLLVLQLNTLTVVVAVIALILSMLYPLMKRFMPLPQVMLGIAWYLGIIMSFTATLGYVPLTGWLLYLTGIIWTIIYDTMYAMCDKTDDLQLGLYSSALTFGSYTRVILGILQFIMLLLLVVIGWLNQLSLYYYLSLVATIGFFLYQQHLLKQHSTQYYFDAFTNNHWVGLSIFLGIFFSLI